MALVDKETLEQIASVEDLHRTLDVVSIKGWVAVLFFVLLAVGTVVWAIAGSLPVTASGKCIALPEGENLKILAFLPLFSGHQIRAGMGAKAALDTVNTGRYGMLEGVVKEVLPYPVSASDPLLEEIPSPSLRDYLVKGELPTILVVIEPYVDTTSPSGFKWTSKRGPATLITPGSVGQVQITLQMIKPISYVIPSL